MSGAGATDHGTVAPVVRTIHAALLEDLHTLSVTVHEQRAVLRDRRLRFRPSRLGPGDADVGTFSFVSGGVHRHAC